LVRVKIEDYPNKKKVIGLWSNYKSGVIVCEVCERHCHIPNGYSGFCGNFANFNDELYFLSYGNLSAIESRPIEIKPLYHFYPNSTALTFSGWSCNFKCIWCQNWHLSMTNPNGRYKVIEPKSLVEIAIKRGDDGLCASFNEPTIHLPYLLDCFKLARKKGLYNVIVSNGYMTIKSINLLIEAGLNGLNIDIKGCPESHKKFLPSINPEVIYRNAKYFLDNNIHVEMVFLIVTGVNDDVNCIEWVLKKHVDILGSDIPLHISRYFPAYEYDAPPTNVNLLYRVYEWARGEYGIKYVYIGNIWDIKYETTYCPKCNYPLIIRSGHRVIESRLDGNKCRRCGEKIYLTGRVYA